MEKRVQFQAEYVIKASQNMLFSFCSSPSALAQWFADSVDINKDVYTFIWGKSIEYAKLIEETENEMIRFSWTHGSEDEYFEFQVKMDEVTGDTALIITDYADESEVDDQRLLWDSQIKRLTERLGA